MTDQTQNAAEVVATRDLRWCVGKFVYVRGSSKPLHFMELKSFIIEDATDYSHLFYLRGLRLKSARDGAVDEEMKRWMSGTAVRPIAEVVAHVIKTRGFVQSSLVEYFPGVGLTGEYVKYIIGRERDGSGMSSSVVRYEGRGPANLKGQFLVLQAEAEMETDYSTDLSAPANARNTVTIINLNHSIKYNEAPQFSLEKFLHSFDGPMVIVLRASSGDRPAEHTTVKGRTMQLPALADVKAMLKVPSRDFQFRFVESFDAGFFLPTDGAPTGLLLAYDAQGGNLLDGFARI